MAMSKENVNSKFSLIQGFQSADYPCDKSSYIRFVYSQYHVD